MKQANKKLLGIAILGMSAWLLVIALVLFDNSTQAMLTNNPALISAGQQNQEAPRTLGTSSTLVSNETTSVALTQTPTTNFAHAGHNHDNEAGTLGTQTANHQKYTVWTIIVITSVTLLAVGITFVLVSLRRKSAK